MLKPILFYIQRKSHLHGAISLRQLLALVHQMNLWEPYTARLLSSLQVCRVQRIVNHDGTLSLPDQAKLFITAVLVLLIVRCLSKRLPSQLALPGRVVLDRGNRLPLVAILVLVIPHVGLLMVKTGQGLGLLLSNIVLLSRVKRISVVGSAYAYLTVLQRLEEDRVLTIMLTLLEHAVIEAVRAQIFGLAPRRTCLRRRLTLVH